MPDISNIFIEMLENIQNIFFNQKFDSDEDAMYYLSGTLEMLSQLYYTLRQNDIDSDTFTEKETEFIQVDDNKNKKILKKRFPFLHEFAVDIDINHKDYEPIFEDFSAAEELAYLARIIAQSLNIAKKNNLSESIGFFVFSMLVEGLKSLRYLQLYLFLVDRSNNILEDLLDIEEDEDEDLMNLFDLNENKDEEKEKIIKIEKNKKIINTSSKKK